MEPPKVVSVAAVRPPAAGALSSDDVYASDRMTTRIMRLAPGASIAEHHHPSHNEAFIVHAGALTVRLDDRVHEVRAGDVIQIPAGTVISGSNTGAQEAVVVVVFANAGRPGPLTVPGRPAHH